MLRKLAVLGQPVAHSRSPAMHNAAFSALGLEREWSYEAIELSADEFLDFVPEMELEGFVGANVTIPHKRLALEVADQASAAAREIGAANTLSFSGGAIRADNTDAPALLEALGERPAGKRALVLGAGGSARAMVWALRSGGAEVQIWNRTPERAAALAAEIGGAALGAGEMPPWGEAEIVVNATAIGLAGADPDPDSVPAGFKELAFSADQLSDRQVVVDLVYGETETELVTAAEERGARTIDGREILLRQGALSFQIWTGLEAPIEAMRPAVETPERQR